MNPSDPSRPFLPPIRTWYLPTTFGDIRLRAIDKKHTLVEICKLTHAELAAVRKLRDESIAPGLFRDPWASVEDWTRIPDAFEVGIAKPVEITLAAPIMKIEKVLTRALRKDRSVVTVVSTKPGEYIELRTEPLEEDHGASPHRTPAPAPDAADASKAKPASAVAHPVGQDPAAVAVTVAKPVQGCPAPDFEDAQIRASDVLRAFLLPEQIRDFEKHQQFISIGALTGHRYAITSRHCRSKLFVQHRTVYDLDESRELCVHDWDLPPAEEMLTMHLMLSLPQHEGYIRGLRE